MATPAPLMPKATAVWLLDNTALTFDQIAEFCKLHPLEVKAIADGDSAQGIKGLDPVQTGQLTREQISAAEPDARYPVCLAGENACPPEDAGGPYGYAGLLATLADPGHPDHEEMRDWVGRPFDPSGFDPYRATVLLRRMV